VRWVLDEMLPRAAAARLNALGHDAISVADPVLAASSDEFVYRLAVDEQRVVVTENFSDFARIVAQRIASDEPCVPVVFVRKRDFPRGGGLAAHLADHLDQWATKNPDPYPGPHWP
jgi:predicted nuclease of predicted toxin-antitoxin system